MNFEIEFMPVGEASKGGDAIIVRYETQPGWFWLLIIDGGTADSGKELVAHVRRHYGSKAVIANAILTHSDIDHACGFKEILQELDVRNVWMHLPWLSASSSLPFFADKSLLIDGLEKRIRKEYGLISEIYELALSKGASVDQPFAGKKIGPFTVLSPHPYVYGLLVPQFDRTPDADQKAIESKNLWIGKSLRAFSAPFGKGSVASERQIAETWENERLKEGGKTSATNESSVVLYGDFESRKVLLTGDAGNLALGLSAWQAGEYGLPLKNFSFVQIPHHGSRSNVGPEVLNQLIGPVLPKGSPSRFFAYVSAPKDDLSHPRKMVLNAFTRRGGTVIATQGIAKCYSVGYPTRDGYTTAISLPFATQVEDYD